MHLTTSSPNENLSLVYKLRISRLIFNKRQRIHSERPKLNESGHPGLLAMRAFFGVLVLQRGVFLFSHNRSLLAGAIQNRI